MNILVTGGAGYIGSHFVNKVRKEHVVTVYDDFSQTRANVIEDPNVGYVEGDILDINKLEETFRDTQPDVVVHFAAIANVEPSFSDPAHYYSNNITGTLNVLECMRKVDCKKIIFSSTAATYGETVLEEGQSISEDYPTNPNSPYGYSKLVMERILWDYFKAYGISSIAFRYFNATGLEKGFSCSHKESQVVPALVKAFKNNEPFYIYGTDYPTPDGTPVRDYIHVNDLATAHIKGMEKLDEGICKIYNLGINRGFSVMELIKAGQEVAKKDLEIKFGPRRQGDPSRLVSDSSRAQQELGWKPEYLDIKEIVRSNYEA